MNKLYQIETLLKVLFIICYWVAFGYCIIIAVAACFMAVYRRLKTVEFSVAYLDRFLQNQYGTDIMLIMSFYFTPSASSDGYSLFFYVPLVLHFLTGIAEFIPLARQSQPALDRYFGSYAQITKTYRTQLLHTKAKIQMIYLPITVVLTLFNFSRLVGVVVYFQYILMRAKYSREFNDATTQLDNQIAPKVATVGLKGIYDKIKQLMRSIKARVGAPA